MKRTVSLSSLLIATLLAAGACTGAAVGPGAADDDDVAPPTEPTPGHAYLTILGDRNIFLVHGGQDTLTVQYHDEQGVPLAGEIRFRFEGSTGGATLGALSDITNSQGIAQVELVAGAQGDAAFRLIAEADYATAVDWRIAVSAGEPPVVPLDVTGVYQVESQFNLVEGLPGTAGQIVNSVIEMTDDPNDPATFVIDLALDKIDSTTIVDAVTSFRPGIDAWLNDLLRSHAPTLVTRLLDLGDAFGQVTRRFGLVSELTIAEGGVDAHELAAAHEVLGAVFVIDGGRSEYTLAEMGLGTIRAEHIAVTMSDETLVTLGDETLSLSYGRVLLFALNELIIPQIDPFSDTIGELLAHFINCASISVDLYEYVGLGSPGLYETACDAGLAAASAFIEEKILEIDATATALVIHGEAKPMDTDGDRTVDQLQNGLWEGVMQLGPLASTLAKPEQKFNGLRSGAVQ